MMDVAKNKNTTSSASNPPVNSSSNPPITSSTDESSLRPSSAIYSNHAHSYSQSSFNSQLSTPPILNDLVSHDEDSLTQYKSNDSAEDYFQYKTVAALSDSSLEKPRLSLDVLADYKTTSEQGRQAPAPASAAAAAAAASSSSFTKPSTHSITIPSTPTHSITIPTTPVMAANRAMKKSLSINCGEFQLRASPLKKALACQFVSPVEDEKNFDYESSESDDTHSINSQLCSIDKSTFTPNYHAYRFLLVDDNIINLKILGRILHKLYPNAGIVEVQDSTKVMQLVEANSFDLIFLDIEMPEVSGTDIARDIRLTHKRMAYEKLGLIAVTTRHSFADLKVYDAVGIDYTLAKPLNYGHSYMRNCIDNVLAYRNGY